MNSNDLQNYRYELRLNPAKWCENFYSPYFKTILLFITNQCNSHCESCFNKNNLGDSKEMSFAYIKTIIDNNPQVSKYDIMGGEPLLHAELNNIISYLEKKDKKIGLYTNGLLLNRLRTDYKNLKLNMSFHSIDSANFSLKPIKPITAQIEKFEKIYPIKICFLMSEGNKNYLKDFAQYVEEHFLNVYKLTIGALRDESDYWSNNHSNILPLEEYCALVQDFLDSYQGRLNVDVFTEGVINSPALPKSQPNQINRFKCIFVDNKYADCLYDIGMDKKIAFDPSKPIKFHDYKRCPRYDKENCLTDKIKLFKI